jgi:hypothetical protein
MEECFLSHTDLETASPIAVVAACDQADSAMGGFSEPVLGERLRQVLFCWMLQ